MTRRRAPRPAAEALRSVRAQAAPATALAAVQASWERIVGARLAAAATPVSERSGTLTVECVDAIWVQELDLMQAQLLDRLRAELGEAAPEALRFRLAKGRD